MTVAELYSQVAALGFETSLESSEVFYNAAQRAVLEVNRIRPRVSLVEIDHVSPDNLIDDVFQPKHVKGELSFIGTSPRCAYFEYNGCGRVFFETLGDDGEFDPFYEREFSHEGNGFSEMRVLLDKKDGPVRMRIVGDYVFSVRNVAMYEDLWGPTETDVPKRGAYICYDMKDIVGDFLEFNNPAIAVGEEYISPAEDYRIESESRILLPCGKPGVYRVSYKRLPKAIGMDNSFEDSEEQIDLEEDLAALLPNLIAVYVYANDEPELSEYYLSLYRQAAAEIRAAVRSATPVQVRSANGW